MDEENIALLCITARDTIFVVKNVVVSEAINKEGVFDDEKTDDVNEALVVHADEDLDWAGLGVGGGI